MRRKAIQILLISVLSSCAVVDEGFPDELVEGVPGSSVATPAFTGAPRLELPDTAVSTVATGLRIPWGLAFLPDGTALVTERGNQAGESDGARIMSITPEGTVTEAQRLPEVDLRPGEGGLLGIAVSPSYPTDGWVYIYYSAAADNRIARLHLGQSPEPIVTGIPVFGDHRADSTRAGGSPSAPMACSTPARARRISTARSRRTRTRSAGRSCG